MKGIAYAIIQSIMCLKASRQINAYQIDNFQVPRRNMSYLGVQIIHLVKFQFESFVVRRTSTNWRSYMRGCYGLFSITQPLHVKPCLNEVTSCRYRCIKCGAWPLRSLNAFMAIILPIWIIYSNSPIWNMVCLAPMVQRVSMPEFLMIWIHYGTRLNILLSPWQWMPICHT